MTSKDLPSTRNRLLLELSREFYEKIIFCRNGERGEQGEDRKEGTINNSRMTYSPTRRYFFRRYPVSRYRE